MAKISLHPEDLEKQLSKIQDIIPFSYGRGMREILPLELKDVVTEDATFRISRTSQLKQLKKDAENEVEGIFLFSGDKFTTRCRHAAMLFLAAKMKIGHLNLSFIKWVQLSYGFNEPLLNEENSLTPEVLVIDAVYENSTPNTFEKVRSLISKLDPPITIILGAGCDPTTLAHKRLYIDAARVLYFGNNKA